MVAKRITRRALVSGALVTGAGLAMRTPAIRARPTPEPGRRGKSSDIAMAGVDPANAMWVPGPALDGVPELGERLLPGVSFTSNSWSAGMLSRGGAVYATGTPDGGDDTLFALDGVTGDERWRVEGVDGLLALTPGAAIVQRNVWDDALATVAAVAVGGSGADLWQVKARGRGRTVVDGDLVLVSTWDGPFAIDGATGAVAWDRQDLELGGTFEIAVGDGIIVGTEPTETNVVRGLSLDSGERLWELEFERPVQTAPLISEDGVWMCDPLELVELDLRSGEERRRIELPQAMPFNGRLALAGTTLVISDISGLSAIDLEMGEAIWTYAPRFGTGFDLLLAGTTACLRVKDSASIEVNRILQGIDLSTGDPRWEIPEPGSDAAADFVVHFLVAGDRLWLATHNGLRACRFIDAPDPGIASPIQDNTFTSEAAGFSYAWTDEWEPGDTSWLLGEDGLRFQSTDGQALATQYVQDVDEPMSPDEIAWSIAGVPPGGELSLDPSPLVVAFPRSFGPDTSRLRGLVSANPPDLSGTVPDGSGVALVLAQTVLNPPFDRMLMLIVAVPLGDPAKALVFEFGTAESLFDEWLPSFLAFFDQLRIE